MWWLYEIIFNEFKHPMNLRILDFKELVGKKAKQNETKKHAFIFQKFSFKNANR